MLKILKNLKQSFTFVVMIVMLLCIQAWADLALPSYTSKIVNEGIQAGGIESAIPEIISVEDFNKMQMLPNEEIKNILNQSYSINTNNTDEQKKIINKYYGKNNNPEKNKIYVLNNINESQKEQLKSTILDIITQDPKTKNMPDSIKEQASIYTVKMLYKNAGIDTDKLQNNYILFAGLQMLGIALISMVSAILITLLSARVAAKLGRTLREKVFKKVLSFSHAEFTKFSTASLITRSTNDVQQIQQLMAMMFRVLVYAPIMGIGAFVKVLTESNNSMAWIIGVAILAILFIVGTLFILAMPKFKKFQTLIDKLNQVSREILTGLPVIRAFNKEKKEEKRFENANSDLMKTNLFIGRTMSTMMPLLMFVMNAITILIIWKGGYNIDNGIMQVGDMMAFIQYTIQIVMSFLFISLLSIMLPRASVAAGRINEVLETEPAIRDKEKVKKFDDNKKGLVEFKNVSFRYPDADTEILEDITFTANPGETTAIIGSTGSGKSTIVNLIPRFYDVTEGELLIDGVNIKDVAQHELRDRIGVVPQKGVLFSGTIESNIKYSNEDMSDDTMKEAAKIAQATEFIESKEETYKSEIAQLGSNVSGGQKQRLAIARAIAKKPEIFIFDDSFSALDFKTDSKLREALADKVKDKTVIIVAQRINTILNADKIIVLDEGKIVGIGKHEELLKNNETYRQIALSQLSEEELG